MTDPGQSLQGPYVTAGITPFWSRVTSRSEHLTPQSLLTRPGCPLCVTLGPSGLCLRREELSVSEACQGSYPGDLSSGLVPCHVLRAWPQVTWKLVKKANPRQPPDPAPRGPDPLNEKIWG